MEHYRAQTILKDIRDGNEYRQPLSVTNDYALENLMYELLDQYPNVEKEARWTPQQRNRLYLIMLEWTALFSDPTRRIRWISDLTDLLSYDRTIQL